MTFLGGCGAKLSIAGGEPVLSIVGRGGRGAFTAHTGEKKPMATPDSLSLSARGLRKWTNPVLVINLIGVGLVFVLSVAAFTVYPGEPIAFGLFSAASLAVAALPMYGRLSVFTLFLSAFLSLGFSVKLVSFLLLGVDFIEPIGGFSYSSQAWDQTLLISASGLAAVAAAGALCKLFDTQKETSHLDLGRSPLFAKIAWPLFLLSIVVTISVFDFNYRYSILKVGVVPLRYFGMLPNVSIAFTVSWGAMIWLGGLTFWMITAGKLPVVALFYVAAIEGAIASVSMSSRVQMILHVAAAFGAYWTCASRLGWRLSKMSWLLIAVTIALLFVASIAMVSVGRVSAFPDAAPAVQSAGESSLATGKSTLATGKSAFANPAPASSAPPKSLAMLKRVFHEINTLFIGRWIGLEGAMVVSSANGLDWNLLSAGLLERGDTGVDSIYQRMADAKYPRYSNYIFQTLPGPVAILFYSGSYIILAGGMGFIFIVCYTLESLAERASRNPAVSSVVGVALAYLFVQMNYPRTFLIFTVEIVAALALFATIWIVLARGSASTIKSSAA
jgi:hypothetical protein